MIERIRGEFALKARWQGADDPDREGGPAAQLGGSKPSAPGEQAGTGRNATDTQDAGLGGAEQGVECLSVVILKPKDVW